MGLAKPVLGYPSKSAAAAALRKKGMRDKDIAPLIGATPASVGNLVRHGAGSYIRRKLQRAAEARGMTVLELKRKLLLVIVRDNLIGATLDRDGEEC